MIECFSWHQLRLGKTYEVSVQFWQVEFNEHVKLVAKNFEASKVLIKQLLQIVLPDKSYQGPEGLFLGESCWVSTLQTYQ